MAWNRPTLAELIARVESDFSTKFFGTAAALRRGVLRVLARVWAGVVYLLHLYQAWKYDQGFAHLADDDQLDRHGQEVGVYRKAPTYASGVVLFTGTEGSPIEQGTLVQTSAQVEYQTTADAVVEFGGTVSVTITALVAGVAGNLDAGSTVSLVTPLPGIDPDATTAAGISGGSDLEGPEDYRARILYKKRNPPQGGADADYVIWATAVAPVTDAWVFPNFPEANSVTVRVANYNTSPPVLTTDEVAGVLAYLTDRTRKPVTADVRVASVQPSAVAVAAQLRPLNASTQAAATAELENLFSAHGRDAGDPGAPGTTIARSQIQDAIAGATGVTGVRLVLVTQDGATVEDVAFTLNQVGVLASSTYLPWE